RDHLRLEHFEFALVAEELGNPDEEIVEEVLNFILVVAQKIDVGGNIIDLHDLHATLDAAKESVLLIAVKVISRLVTETVGYPSQRRRRRSQHFVETLLLLHSPQVAGVDPDMLSDFFGRQDKISDCRRRVAVR